MRFTQFLIFTSFLFVFGCSSASKNSPELSKKAKLYYGHGTSNLLKKNYTEALDHLIKAHKLAPNNSKVTNNLGMAYFFKGKQETAIKYIKKSIKLDPKNSDAKINLASILYRMGRYGESKKYYQDVTKDLVYKHQYRTYYNLSLIALKENNAESAIKLLKKSIGERSDYCPAFFKMGEIYRHLRNYKSALENFRQASLGDCINNPAPIYQQALTLERLGKRNRAAAKYQEVIDRHGKSREAVLANVRLRDIKKKTNIEEPLVIRDKKASLKYTDKELEDELEKYESPNF